jgi:hypothetical protein
MLRAPLPNWSKIDRGFRNVAEPVLTTVFRELAKVLGTKSLYWLVKRLPQNSPEAKAKAAAVAKYRTRVPDLDRALEAWMTSDEFRAQLERIQKGEQVSNVEMEHVVVFMNVTGLGFGSVPLDLAGEAITCFYTELYLALVDGPSPHRTMGATLLAIRENVRASVPLGGKPLQAAPYLPRIEVDTTGCAQTEADRQVEGQLNLIKALVDKKKG